MSSDRPFYFFELSGESEVVLWGKFCFEAYIDICEEWVVRPKTRCGPNQSLYFFWVRLGYRGRFWMFSHWLDCIQTYVEKGLGTQRRDMGPDRPLYFFRVRLGYRGRFWMFNHWLDCIQTYVQEGLYIQKRDMCPERPISFFELSGESEVVLWWKILFGTVYRHTWGMNFTTNRIWPRIRPLFFELSGESEVVLWGKFCFELYIDICEEWVFCPKTRCGPQSVPVFFSSQAGVQRSFLDV